jgi:hypothetical protein
MPIVTSCYTYRKPLVLAAYFFVFIIMSISINVLDFFALAPSLGDQSAWCEWASAPYVPAGQLPVCDLLPAMMARRMSSASRLAVQVGLVLQKKYQATHVVFASRHAELPRTVRLLQQILADDFTSPTDFSQSVHNTAAGLFSIAGSYPLPVSSIAAGENTFQQALIEATVILKLGIAARVLLVMFDDALPALYQTFIQGHHFPYAAGFILSASDAERCVWRCESHSSPLENLSLSNVANDRSAIQCFPQALQYLHHYLRQTPHFTVSGDRQSWSWVRQ